MESDETDKTVVAGTSTGDIESQCAVNSLILDYYKKFGRKRDLEQFFSLSTAQSDIRDTSGVFWRKMKSENDSSDSGGRRSDSSPQELCRISIRCSLPDPSSSQSDDPKTKTESPETESPPIIVEEAPIDVSRHTDDESFKSDDNHSQKSFDPLLDLSAHKPLSPTSSIASQRKLEWDSLADVGYGNESDRKTSGSSLSTLERLALKQQYSNNDSKQEFGIPTSHSTPLDENESKSKSKKGAGRKMTKITKKDVDFLEVNMPHTSDANPSQSISVNLTKHISFNVEKDGGITVDNIRKNINVSPEKVTVQQVSPPVDKEIQASLPKATKSSVDELKPIDINSQKIPVMISLNTLRKRLRRKKTKVIRRRVRSRAKINERKEVSPQEKSGEPLSEAESFEYMPGHIYNQNQLQANEDNAARPDHNSTAGNKSSLESSGGITTDSSKGSKHSLTQDLEKCIEVLKVTLQKRYEDGEVKKRLIKEIVQRLLSSRYRDDESTTDFLSGLTFNANKLNVAENTTTSTSDSNNNNNDSKPKRTRKSILRMDKFNSNMVSSSQSAPNLFSAASTEKLNINMPKMASNTESDQSSKEKTSSDNVLAKTSSEKLYAKYLEALRREESYKRHLKDKEVFLKQKLASSDIDFKAPRHEAKINNRLKDLMKDLVRNNYGDGSGDASKLEGGSLPDSNGHRLSATGRSQRSHSVFTLTSSPECQKKPNLKKKVLDRDFGVNTSKNQHYCCCPHHSATSKVEYVDSSVQVNIKCEYDTDTNAKLKHYQSDKYPKCQRCEIVPELHMQSDKTRNEIKGSCKECHDQLKHCQQNIGSKKCDKYIDCEPTVTCQKCYKSPRHITKMVPDRNTGEIKYVCVCNEKAASSTNTGEIMIYKCTKLTNRGIQFEDPANEINVAAQCGSCKSSEEYGIKMLRPPSNFDHQSSSGRTSNFLKNSQFSQTEFKILDTDVKEINVKSTKTFANSAKPKKVITIYEATRSIQTEISFNPRIADPKMSDIVIVNNCVKLISEQRREKVLSSENSEHRKTFSDVCTSSGTGNFLLSSDDSLFRVDSKEPSLIEAVGNVLSSENVPKDYNIPIHGTNMTLKVTLASMDNKNIKGQVDQACGTTKTSIANQGTCIALECGKSVQCSNIAKTSTTKSTPASDHSSNKSSASGRVSPKKACLSKPATSRSPIRSTYPKTVQLKDKKPLRRSNTDIGNFETYCGYVQTEPVNIFPPSPNKQSESKTHESYYEAHDASVCKKTPRETGPRDVSPRKQPKSKIDSTESRRHAGDVDVDKIKPQHHESLHSSPRKQTKSISTTSESCCPTGDVNLKQVITQDQILRESSRKQAESKSTTSQLSYQKGVEAINKPMNQDNTLPPLHPWKQPESEAVTSEFSCQTPEPNINKNKLVAGDRSSGNKTSHKKEIGIQKDMSGDESDKRKSSPEMISKSVGSPRVTSALGYDCSCQTYDNYKNVEFKQVEEKDLKKERCCDKENLRKSSKESVSTGKSKTRENRGSKDSSECVAEKATGFDDPIMNMIQDITRRYSKKDIMKIKKKKCFTEIVGVLNYLLETEDSTDQEPKSVYITPKSSDNSSKHSPEEESANCCNKSTSKFIRQPSKSPTRFNKSSITCFQNSSHSPSRSDKKNKKLKLASSCCEKNKKSLKHTESESLPCKHDKDCEKLTSKSTSKCTESSDIPCSTDLPSTSDSTACKILNKIRRECEKYHFRRTKCGRKCEVSSSTSINCETCKKVHHCGCRHKCKRSKTVDKYQKKCVAYNLILQTSESMLSEETVTGQIRPLQNIVVKVPKHKEKARTETCKETIYKIEKGLRSHGSPRGQRSRSCPKENEMSSADDYERTTQQCTVREYLEKNRPDFVEKCSERQNCLKFINEMRANERAAHRDLLSLHVDRQPDLTTLSTEQLRQLAQQIGVDMRRKKPAPKFISEREMKKHSENIYKTLPEVTQKKEEKKKENIKKTNLLMANIFKKNLQKKTLRGSVNLSNYSTVIKI